MEVEKNLTIREAAKLVGYSERQIRQMCIDSKIPGAYRLPKGRKWLIPESALGAIGKEEGEKLEAKKPSSRAEVLRVDQEKYRDHWGKLAKLAGELALCLEFRSGFVMLVPIAVGRLPVPGKVVDTRTYPKLLSYPDEPGGCFFNYSRFSLSAEKSPLYEPLTEHLGAEFPKWREELQRAREVAAGWFKSNEEALWHLVADDESIRKLRTRLYLSSERGIFYGKCPICRDW